MKISLRPGRIEIAFSVVIVALILSTIGRAQTNQTYDGGTNVWDAGTTQDWDSGAHTWTNGNNAIFNGTTANVVTVDGTVISNDMTFNASGGTTISGGMIDQLAHPASAVPPATTYDPTLITVNNGSGPVVISSAIELSDMGPDQQTFIVNNSASDLTIGSIDFGPYTLNPSATAIRRVQLYSNTATGSITLNGTYTDSVANHLGQINIVGSNSGIINIASNADFSGFVSGQMNNYVGGTINIDNSSFQSDFTFAVTNANGLNLLNLQGAQTIVAAVYDSTKNSGTKDSDGVSTYGYLHINQGTADASTWSGNINQDGSNVNLSAVAGGQLTFSGLIQNHTPQGLIISGAGTVVISNAQTYDEEDGNGYLLNTTPVAADIQSGTLLITNTTGSAFGKNTTSGRDPANSSNVITSNPSIVKVEAGATLGGSGISTQTIDMVSATSVLAPHNLVIGSNTQLLTLSGGITAADGLTMNFSLSDPADSDTISLSYLPPVGGGPEVDGNFTIGGPVTINFNIVGTIETGVDYFLVYGGSNSVFSDTDATPFTFNGLDGSGYVVSSYDFNTADKDLTVEFAAVPEPSIYGLLGLGLLALVAISRFRRLSA